MSETRSSETSGFLIIRLFLSLFWILQSVGKAIDKKTGLITFSNLQAWAGHTVGSFAATPLPSWLVRPFVDAIPLIELGIGLLLLVGWQTRRALLGAALLLIGLDVGLMFQLEHEKVATNTVYLLLAVFGLRWERSNAWALDRRILKARSGLEHSPQLEAHSHSP